MDQPLIPMRVSLKKVTIVAERLLREQLVEMLNEEGSTGHTMTAVQGAGVARYPRLGLGGA